MRCSIESSTEYSGPQAIDLPPEYIERLERLFDGDAKRLKACLHDMAADGPTAFRVNGLQATWEQVRDELEQVGIEPDRLDGIDGVWTVPSQSHRALTDTPAARDGRI